MSPHSRQWLEPKRQQITSFGENVEKRDPLRTVGGNVLPSSLQYYLEWSTYENNISVHRQRHG